MAEQTLDSNQLILQRRTFGAIWVVTAALLAYTFLVGGSVFLSTWWMIAITSTAFAPLVVFVVGLVPFCSRRRPLLQANHRSFVPVSFLAVAAGVAAFFAVGSMKSTQIEAVRRALGAEGDVLLPKDVPITSLFGPLEAVDVTLKFRDSKGYFRQAMPRLPSNWIVTSLDGTPDMFSPIEKGMQWMVIGTDTYVTIVRVRAGEFSGILTQSWMHPDGKPLSESDWSRYGKRS